MREMWNTDENGGGGNMDGNGVGVCGIGMG